MVIFTGAGKAFSAGGDIVGMKKMYEDTEMFDRSINEAKKVVFGILDLRQDHHRQGQWRRGLALGATMGAVLRHHHRRRSCPLSETPMCVSASRPAMAAR